jgi:hypothetical protein
MHPSDFPSKAAYEAAVAAQRSRSKLIALAACAVTAVLIVVVYGATR